MAKSISGSTSVSAIDGSVEAANVCAPEMSLLAGAMLPDSVFTNSLASSSPERSPKQFATILNRLVALIDKQISDQVNAILHHPDFQRLEASWRGLAFLAGRERSEFSPSIKIKVLDVSWTELARDLDQAIDFDQSEFFHKVYENEFGTPGGEPFGILIGDYEIHPRPAAGVRYDDLDVLQAIAGVAAAAFCPFVANASPGMFGLGDSREDGKPVSFSGMEQTLDHAHHLKTYPKWQSLRAGEDVRFVGLALPRVLMRLPHEPDCGGGISFAEDVAGPDQSRFLWAGAAFALGAVVLRAFENAAWPADIRGVQRGVDAGGLVSGLPIDEPGTDSPRVALKPTTDLVITDALEKQLGELGFISLCHCQDTPYAAFYSVPSIQKAAKTDRGTSDANAQLSAMLPYMLCVSRFAHYVKVMARDRMGTVTSAEELERILHAFLAQDVVQDDEAGPSVKARSPLREAKVQVLPKPGSPGAYLCVIHLVPHYELDDMAVRVRLTTEISAARTRS